MFAVCIHLVCALLHLQHCARTRIGRHNHCSSVCMCNCCLCCVCVCVREFDTDSALQIAKEARLDIKRLSGQETQFARFWARIQCEHITHCMCNVHWWWWRRRCVCCEYVLCSACDRITFLIAIGIELQLHLLAACFYSIFSLLLCITWPPMASFSCHSFTLECN